jgi:cytoskeletal protein CcmA (bactofilin family)
MPSTYTVNLGIEKPATGEQSGTWGDTVNDNSNILDEAINGAVTITLTSAGSSGSPNSITITNGASSTGRNKWIEFGDGGDLGAAAYVQLTPNDAEKICNIRNSLSGNRSIFIFQGNYSASNDLEIAAGTDVVVKFNGGGTGATVVNVYANLKVDGIVATTADINGGTIDATVIGGSTAAAVTGTTVVANTSVNIAGDGATVTGIKDEDNMASNSATKLATQQSIKAYVDSQVGTVDTLAEILANGNTTGSTDIDVNAAQKVQFRDAAIYINSSVDGQLDIVADTEIQIAATTIDINGAIVASGDISAASLDISGDVDIDGTLNVDAIDIDGAVQLDATLTVGVDDTGYDVKFYGATGGAYMLWDQSADDLILAGAGGLVVAGNVDFNGDLDVDGTTNLDVVDIDGAVDMASTLTVAGVLTGASLDISGDIDVDGTTNLDVVDIDGAVDMASTLTVAGAVTGSSSFATAAGGTFTTASGNDLNIVYPDGRSLFFKEAGTTTLSLDNAQGATFAGTIAAGAATFTTADNSAQLTLISTDADANTGPLLVLDRQSASPADGDSIGAISFNGKNDAAEAHGYAKIEARIVDASNATEDGRLELMTSVATEEGISRILMTNLETAINDNSKDLDFRVESNNQSEMLIVNAGTDLVGIKGNPAGANGVLQVTGSIGLTGSAEIRQSTNADDGSTLRFLGTQLVIANSNANGYGYSGGGFVASVSPSAGSITLDAGANSTSGHRLKVINGGDGVAGSLQYLSGSNNRFSVDSSAGTVAVGNSTQAVTLVRLDHENSTGKGELQLNAHGSASFSMLSNFTGSTLNGVATGNFGLITPHNAGISINTSDLERMKIDGSGNTVFNEGGLDADFRVESDNDANAFFVQGSNGFVGIGTGSPTSITGAAGPIIDMQGPNPEIVFHDNSGTANSMSMYYLNDALRWWGSGAANLTLDNSGNLTVAGALSKGSGSFKIDHPLPAKTETHNLVHSFIEGPQADNIYRGKVTLVDGSATVNIDTVSGMSEGTYVLLNTNTQCFTSNESGWNAVKGSVSGNILTITAQESCSDTISWMVVGERHDQHMLDIEWTDENGKVIVEPLKELES